MSAVSTSKEIEFRLGLLERASVEFSTRLEELTVLLESKFGKSLGGDGAVPQPVEIGAEAISPFATGFHIKEVDGDDRAYRWTGNADFFEMRFNLEREVQWSFTMEIMTNPNVDIKTMRGFVDYAEIPIQIDETERYVRGVIPVRRLSGLVTLAFYQPSRFVPSHLDETSQDHRSLGIVFYGVKLSPIPGKET